MEPGKESWPKGQVFQGKMKKWGHRWPHREILLIFFIVFYFPILTFFDMELLPPLSSVTVRVTE